MAKGKRRKSSGANRATAARSLRAACDGNDLEKARELLAAGAAPTVGDETTGKTAFYLAAKRGNVELMELLLDHGADLHVQTERGKSPLYVAASRGGVEAVRFLLDRGHDVNVKDELGRTALFGAAWYNNVDVIHVLIEAGIDIHAVANDERTALHNAATAGSVEAVQCLVKAGLSIHAVDEDGRGVLHRAKDVATLRALLELGADIHATTKEGMTALHFAAERGDVKAVALLLKRGAKADVLTENGASVLNYAATGGSVAVMKLLIENGANVHTTENDGRTVLHSAARAGSLDVATFLLGLGLAIDAVDNDGQTVFDYAVLTDDVRILRLLVKHGVDVHTDGKGGGAKLLIAANESLPNSVAFLLKLGVPVTAKNSEGENAFQVAAWAGNVEIMQNLIDHGVDIHATANDGRTALHDAARQDNVEVVEFLLDQGLSLEAVDENGATPFHYAALGGNVEIIQLLIDRGADVYASTPNQETALHYAAFRCNADALEILLQYGLAIDLAEQDGSTVLHNAVIEGNVGAVRLLIDRGADDGQSVLHVCAANGTLEAAKILFDHGVDASETDKDGETPLHKAARNGHVDTMRLLIAQGADARAETNAHENIAHLAAQEGHADALAYALELGIDANSRAQIDGESRSLLMIAFDIEDHKAAREIAFTLCSASADFDDADRQKVQRISEATNNSADEECDEDSLWHSGLYASVDRWIQERQAGESDLTSIPFEVISRGEASVKAYLDDVARSSQEDRLHRCKVCVVGPSEWGKTSLVQSLKANKTFLTQLKDRTVGIDLTTCELNSTVDGLNTRLEVTFWDFAGQDVYHAAHTLFFSQRTLFVLVVDLQAYWKELQSAESKQNRNSEAQMNRFVSAKIFRWVRSIFAHRPDAQFVVVGSKVNRLEDPSVVTEIWDDFRDRLDRWKAAFAKGFDRELLPARASAKDIKSLQARLTNVGSSNWLVTNIMEVESIQAFRSAVQETITSSDLGFPMWKTYAQVLQSVVRRREEARNAVSARDRIEKSIIRFSNLRRQLLREIEDLDRDACEQILRTLSDLGDVLWYEHDGAGVFKDCIILDPMLVIEVVREVVRHDFSSDTSGKPPHDGRITHSLLSIFPLWKDMDVELTHAFKALLQHFQLAYPADAEDMLPDSDIIVPAYWNADHASGSAARFKPISQSIAPQPSMCDAFAMHRWCWEYEIPTELGETIFVQFAVQSHSSYLPRTIRGFCVEAGCVEFATSISLVQNDSPRDVLRIEVSGVSAELSWHNMRFYLMKIEKVLEGYPGDVVWRFIVDRTVGSTSESRHPVGPLMKAVEDAIVMGKGEDAARDKMPWMPPDVDWFMRKSWNDIASFQQLRMNRLVQEKLEVLEKLAIAGDAPRQFPALWSLEYDPKAQKALLRMSSDLSGRCYHIPLEIDTGSAMLARHASVFKAGVSLFATVVGNAISLPIVQTVLDTVKSAFENNVDHAEHVHNLIDKLDLVSDRFDSRTTSKLSPAASMVLLRDLLKAYDDSLDALEISEISNLECAVTSKGEYVWAHKHEITALEGKITPCAAPPSTWKELEMPATAPTAESFPEVGMAAESVSPTSTSSTKVSSPMPTNSKTPRSSKAGFKISLSVNAVAGLSDWDWHKTYCKWQLYYRKSLTPLAVDVTPTNSDNSRAPSWSSMRTTVEAVTSLEMLRECRLSVQVKRRSRIGWTKLIGDGEVWLRDFLDEDAAQNFSCEPVSVPLGATSDRTVIIHLALEH